MPLDPDRPPRYRTGDDELDATIARLVTASKVAPDEDLVFEMVTSALRMGREAADRGELKLVSAVLKELRYSFHVFEPYAHRRKLSMFGSARIRSGTPEYDDARDLGRMMAERDWMVITGAGPGIMAAGIEGAGAENSFGVNILLPFEASASEFIAGDPKLINFKYFFTRKLMFLKESHAFALLPGGFGTMDEAFELLTLMQTGRSPIVPVVLLDPPGSTYWETFRDFVRRELVDRSLVAASDLDLFLITENLDDAVDEVTGFYRNYHSARSVGRRLVLRMHEEPDDALVERLEDEFADIVESGPIERIDATPSEVEDDDVVDLHRLAFRFDRRSYSRLRHLIDVLNGRR
ncbi:MAG: LOG family protein [Acidimicrobiia bacterium]|nr:LOG family protein [Acidimicrobiia bacterium]